MLVRRWWSHEVSCIRVAVVSRGCEARSGSCVRTDVGSRSSIRVCGHDSRGRRVHDAAASGLCDEADDNGDECADQQECGDHCARDDAAGYSVAQTAVVAFFCKRKTTQLVKRK